MSTAVSCTRAVAPRVTSRIIPCRRYASTETVVVAAEPASRPILSSAKVKKISEAPGVHMHRLLYPHLYVRKDERNWAPGKDVQRVKQRQVKAKHVNARWHATMKEQGVQTNLSMFSNIIRITNRLNLGSGYPMPTTARVLTTSRQTFRRPNFQTNSTKHQENLPRPRQSRHRLPNIPPRPLRRPNPPLCERQPRMRSRRRHPARSPKNRRPLRRSLHKHSPARRRHRNSSPWPIDPRGCRNVVQSVQPVSRGH